MSTQLLLLCAACVAARASLNDDLDAMKKDIQAIVDARAQVYNCSFSVSFKSATLGSTMTFASKDITAEAKFAWGSITKMWTGASIMQLVAAEKLKLEEPFAPYVDAQLAAMRKMGFPGMNFSKLSDLWGQDVNKVTIHDLLHMQSGIPDFDTAKPSRTGGPDLDPFRATAYANPSSDFLEPTLMSVPWVATHNLTSTPGEGFHYSSTNFGLLGLILAHHAGVSDYRSFNQSSFLPSELAEVAKSIEWARTGSPRDNGVVEGFDRTDYNGQDPKAGGVSVFDVHGVFSGWSASDFVGPTSAVAELGYSLWGNASSLVPRKYRDMMVPKTEFYGLASQNVGLMGITGGKGDFKTAYGHLGATYGYDSIFGYNPRLDLALSVATSIETNTQTQPSDAFCRVFNRIKNYLAKEPIQECTYKTFGYYGGVCSCKASEDIVLV